MKAYAFLDLDGNLQVRTIEYIDTENPAFWQENKVYLLKVWRFDTDDMASMHRMYSQFRDIELDQRKVLEFTRSIGFEISRLKEYESGIRSNKN